MRSDKEWSIGGGRWLIDGKKVTADLGAHRGRKSARRAAISSATTEFEVVGSKDHAAD
jgi:hypothetical protein